VNGDQAATEGNSSLYSKHANSNVDTINTCRATIDEGSSMDAISVYSPNPAFTQLHPVSKRSLTFQGSGCSFLKIVLPMVTKRESPQLFNKNISTAILTKA
jgi:hypothetical protein